jgi:hypothetical protein
LHELYNDNKLKISQIDLAIEKIYSYLTEKIEILNLENENNLLFDEL